MRDYIIQHSRILVGGRYLKAMSIGSPGIPKTVCPVFLPRVLLSYTLGLERQENVKVNSMVIAARLPRIIS